MLIWFIKLYYLAHVQCIRENQPTRIWLKRREAEGDDLEVPGDPHAKEEADVDHHLVPLLAPGAAAAARTVDKSEEIIEVYFTWSCRC